MKKKSAKVTVEFYGADGPKLPGLAPPINKQPTPEEAEELQSLILEGVSEHAAHSLLAANIAARTAGLPELEPCRKDPYGTQPKFEDIYPALNISEADIAKQKEQMKEAFKLNAQAQQTQQQQQQQALRTEQNEQLIKELHESEDKQRILAQQLKDLQDLLPPEEATAKPAKPPQKYVIQPPPPVATSTSS